MKQPVIFFFLLPLFAFNLAACEDKPELPELQGTWHYASAHLLFGYAEDTVRISMGPQSRQYAVEDLQVLLRRLADQMLEKYFQGIVFQKDHRLHLLIKAEGQKVFPLQAVYEQSADYLQIELDSTQLKGISQGAVSQIPAISFSYVLANGDLKLYFDRTYLRLAYAMMADRLVDLLISKAMHQDPAVFPAKIKSKIKDQLDEIVSKITELEIGVNLKQGSSD